MKVQLGATIPVMAYGNLQPVIEAEGETYEEAMDLALRRMQDIWNKTAEKPLELDRHILTPQGNNIRVLQCRVSGQEILFDTVAHTYHDRQGRRYMGGSTFAGKFKSGFPGKSIADKMAVKYGVSADDIQAMWQLNSEVSTSFGTSLHAALELYGKYLELSKKVKAGSDESALTKNPVLKPIVESFFRGREGETAFYEEFICNPAELACGLVDRLVVDEDSGIWIEDFKSNADVNKPCKITGCLAGTVPDTTLGSYIIQGSYYARILTEQGRNVKGVRIHHWTGSEWATYESPVIDITEGMKAL